MNYSYFPRFFDPNPSSNGNSSGSNDQNTDESTPPNRLTIKLINESSLKMNDQLTLADLLVNSDEPLQFEREFSEDVYTYLNNLAATASENDSSYQAPDFSTNYFTMLEPGKDYGDIIRQLSENTDIEFAFEEQYPSKNAVDASDDPMAIFQDYEFASPVGVASFEAWDKNITGTGIQVTDIEDEWDLNHEDFPSGIPLLIGDNKINFTNNDDHGTSVVGIICGQDNDKGIVGIAPDVTMKVASIRFGFSFSVSKALAKAIQESQSGDIILIEEQFTQGSILLPIELFPNIFQLIELATKNNIIVIEPAGNGNIDLDKHHFFLNGKTIFNRNSPDFKDSGSVMVGAASSADPHTRMSFSNFGSRVDCFAYGENVTTTAKNNQYKRNFNGTSSASPIITGVAALVQQYSNDTNGKRLSPSEMRTLLSDPANGTSSANPASDKIGVMPDLKKIII
jgi:subtilisin family serine protease